MLRFWPPIKKDEIFAPQCFSPFAKVTFWSILTGSTQRWHFIKGVGTPRVYIAILKKKQKTTRVN